MPSGLAHLYQLDEFISTFRGVWSTFSFIFILFLIEITAGVSLAASDLGLHGLPMSQKWDARHERVDSQIFQ